jgi:hypothetical protein
MFQPFGAIFRDSTVKGTYYNVAVYLITAEPLKIPPKGRNIQVYINIEYFMLNLFTWIDLLSET